MISWGPCQLLWFGHSVNSLWSPLQPFPCLFQALTQSLTHLELAFIKLRLKGLSTDKIIKLKKSHFSFSFQIWSSPFKGTPALITFLLKQLLLFYSLKKMHYRGYKPQSSSTGDAFRHLWHVCMTLYSRRFYEYTKNTSGIDVECPALFSSFRLQIFALNSAYKGLIMSQNSSVKRI